MENEDKHNKKNRIRKSNKEKHIPMKLWVKFLGWFLSEGSVFSKTTTNYGKKVRFYRVSLSQKDEKNCKEIIQICKKMGFEPYRFKNKQGTSDINISSKQLYEHMKIFNKNKYIPKHIKSLEKKHLEMLFETLMKGDGDKNGGRFSTKYKKFADDFQELLLKIGKAGRIYMEETRGFIIYRIKIAKNKAPVIGDNYKKKVQHKIIKYNNYVYDVSVPNHIIFVRRNGFACWSGNCFGPRQDPNSPYSGVISSFVGRMSNDMQPIVYGDGKQTRDFIYVKDVVEANMLAMNSKKAPGLTFNVATGKQTNLLELIDAINSILGKKIVPHFRDSKNGDIKHSYADVTKATELLGFEAKTVLKDGLQETIEWFNHPK